MLRRRAQIFTLTALAACVATAGLMPGSSAQASETLPTTTASADGSSFLKLWAPEDQNVKHKATLEQAIAAAKSHDLITASLTTYYGMVPAMHAANPRLRVLLYTNATYAHDDQGSTWPDSWYAKDAQGNKVRSKGYGNYLMDLTDRWTATRVRFCDTFAAKAGYDGCMLDMLGTSAVDPHYNETAPINPATHRQWTPAEWITATTELAADIKRGTGRYTIGNGLGNGARYFDTSAPTSALLAGIDGGFAESWLRPAGASADVYPSVGRWQRAVDMLGDAGRRGKVVEVTVKLWGRGTTTQKQAWDDFALASFMLGTDGSSYYNASFAVDADKTEVRPSWVQDYGQPLGGYTIVDGIYQREFTRSLVAVNPTDTAKVMSLTHGEHTAAGEAVDSVTLQPHTGVLLLR